MERNSEIKSRRASRRPALSAARSLALLSALALLPLSGTAQSPDPADLHELDDDTSNVRYENLTIDELEDLNVVRDGKVIGDVDSVLANSDGDIVALVVEYGDNVLGIGDRDVVVPIDALELRRGTNEAVTTMTDEELAKLPTWDR